MNERDRARCVAEGMNDAAFAMSERTVSVSLSATTWCLLDGTAENEGRPIADVLQEHLEAWAADRVIECLRIEAAMKRGATEPRRPRRRLYFIQQGDDGPIKIGVSENVGQRVRHLRTGSAQAVRVLHICEQTGDINERALHRRFAAYRKEGEWFEPHPELIRFIAELPGTRGTNG